MGVNDRVRTDLDLHKESNLGMGVYAIERSNPKVGAGQISKHYLKQLKKNYAHLSKLKHCANADAGMDADADSNDWATKGHSPQTYCVVTISITYRFACHRVFFIPLDRQIICVQNAY